MLKQILVVFISLFLVLFANAGNEKSLGSIAPPQYSDTTKQEKDSSDQQIAGVLNKDKKEFIELVNATPKASTSGLQLLNPLALRFAKDYDEKYGDETREIKEWGRSYLNMIETILLQHNLPKELKYLAIVESELKTNARSSVGAFGPWQLMPETARNLGLKVSRTYDERKDYYKSTHAASKYLKSLFDLYGDWLLVVAAYNSGPGGVNSAIRKSGSRDFWLLQKYLPAETRGHVKRFIAIHYVLEGKGSIATATKAEAEKAVTAAELLPEEITNSKTQSISGRYNSLVITKHITMDIAAFNKLNPDFDKMIASNGNYELRLPDEKMEVFLSKKPEILNESMQILLTPVTNRSESPRL